MSRYIRNIRPKAWWTFGLALWLVALVGLKASTTVQFNRASATAEKVAAQPVVPQSNQLAQQTATKTSSPIDVEECTTCHAKAGSDAFTHSKHAGLTESCVKATPPDTATGCSRSMVVPSPSDPV